MLEAVGVYPLRTAELVRAILADGEPVVRTSTPVQAVEQHDDRVRVRTRAGEEFTASAAVVAVPLNTLGAVDFSPPLDPAKRTAASQGQASHGTKLWAPRGRRARAWVRHGPGQRAVTFVATEQMVDDGSHRDANGLEALRPPSR